MAAVATVAASAVHEVELAPTKTWIGTITGPASYTTGGDTIAASLFGLSRIDQIITGLAVTGESFAVWDGPNGKLKQYTTGGTQVTSTTDTSARLYPAIVTGV